MPKVLGVVASPRVWSEMVAKSFAQFRQTGCMLLFPWGDSCASRDFQLPTGSTAAASGPG